ncbi:hypothetical protein ACPOL_2841 [Acidisarcina polymorpha]|uniref:Uncharacterized protein n=1 Tax=Acidisarcina polymorpha TaxID=2211140 RepID=A0A2Z5G098_9BACT|nr:hypothetical protein ACPOL_2841 [Acidisarcina polymorpha]
METMLPVSVIGVADTSLIFSLRAVTANDFPPVSGGGSLRLCGGQMLGDVHNRGPA